MVSGLDGITRVITTQDKMMGEAEKFVKDYENINGKHRVVSSEVRPRFWFKNLTAEVEHFDNGAVLTRIKAPSGKVVGLQFTDRTLGGNNSIYAEYKEAGSEAMIRTASSHFFNQPPVKGLVFSQDPVTKKWSKENLEMENPGLRDLVPEK